MKYQTHDLGFAAFLLTSGYELAGTEREERRTLFIFTLEAEELDDLKTSWVTGGLIPARRFSETLRSLKSLAIGGI